MTCKEHDLPFRVEVWDDRDTRVEKWWHLARGAIFSLDTLRTIRQNRAPKPNEERGA
jgi:hypothetical protein